MGISGSLNNALSGLTATSRMAELVSSNISNALTDGYGRREISLSSASLGRGSGGVRIDGIGRNVNQSILNDRRLADSELSGQQRLTDFMTRIEVAFGRPEDPSSLSNRLSTFEQSLFAAESDPASEQQLAITARSLGGVATKLNMLNDNIQGMRQQADGMIAQDVETLNVALAQIEGLNGEISRARASGGNPLALEDQRQLVIDTVAQIVPLRVLPRDGGSVALYSTTGATLIDGQAPTFTFTPTPTIVADMTFAGGALAGISRNGVPLSMTDGYGRLSGGSLEAAFTARDDVLVSAQANIDGIAADLITRFEDVTNDPSLAATDPGLLTDNGARFDPLDQIGLSDRIGLNALIDPDGGGDVTLLRDGLGAIAPGPTGSSAQISRWIDALNEQRTPGFGLPSMAASAQIARTGDIFGAQRVSAEGELGFASARWDAFRQAELADGVDTDQEMQRLLLIEQAYSANAKVIQTISSLMQTLMEI